MEKTFSRLRKASIASISTMINPLLRLTKLKSKKERFSRESCTTVFKTKQKSGKEKESEPSRPLCKKEKTAKSKKKKSDGIVIFALLYLYALALSNGRAKLPRSMRHFFSRKPIPNDQYIYTRRKKKFCEQRIDEALSRPVKRINLKKLHGKLDNKQTNNL